MFKHLIIDGNNFAFRAGSVMYLRNRQGQNVSVMFGLLNMLRSLIEEYQPENACVCWDWKSSKAKISVYPDYKADRKFRDEQTQMFVADIYHQIELLQKVLPFFGIRQVRKMEVEADDLIGILVENLPNVLVVSSDRDLLQVADMGASIFYPPKDTIIDKDNFASLVGIDPSFYVFYRCIIGDPGDNITGLKGFGEVTAKKLLSLYGTWDSWFDTQTGIIKEEILNSVNKKQRGILGSSDTMELLVRNYQLIKIGYLVKDIKDEILEEYNKSIEFDENVIKKFFVDNDFTSYLSKFTTWIHPFRRVSGKLKRIDEINEMKEIATMD